MPDAVLRKPGRLTVAERDLMRSHVAVGEQLVERVPYLAGASKIKNGSSVVYTVSLGGTHEGKVFVATLTEDADPYLGLGVAAGNFNVGDPAEPEYLLVSTDFLRVYVDGKPDSPWSWPPVDNTGACPLSLPIPSPWTTATGQHAYASQCTARQTRWPSRTRNRLVTTTATSRSTATAPRPSHRGW